MPLFDLNKVPGSKGILNAAKKAVDKIEQSTDVLVKKSTSTATQALDGLTGSDQASSLIKEKYDQVTGVSEELTDKAKQVIDQVAIKTSDKVNQVSGLNTSPEDIKKAALAAALVAAAAGSMEAGGEMDSGSPESDVDSSAGGSEGFDSSSPESNSSPQSFEEETNQFFADKGGLNIKTDVVDMDGCILDSGA